MTPAFDSVEGDLSTIFAAVVDLRRHAIPEVGDDGGRVAAVPLDPAGDRLFHGQCLPRTLDEGPVHANDRISCAVHLENRNRPRGSAGRRNPRTHRARDGRDCRYLVGQLASQPLREDSAIRYAVRVDPLFIDGELATKLCY